MYEWIDVNVQLKLKDNFDYSLNQIRKEEGSGSQLSLLKCSRYSHKKLC